MAMEDFHKHEAADCQKSKEVAQSLYQAILKIFSKRIDWVKAHQCKQRPGKIIFDYFKKFEKTFKQPSGIEPESFIHHQNNPILNSIVLAGIDEELA